MAKAGDDSSTIWILLADAAHLVAGACGYALKLAEADLVRWLGNKKIRWQGKLRGQRRDEDDPDEGSPEFWQGGPCVQLSGPLSESRAQRTTWASAPGSLVARSGERAVRPALLSRYGYYLIEGAREDVIAALPAAAQARLVETARVAVQEVAPAGPVVKPTPQKNRGGRRETWNWQELKAELPVIIVKKTSFKNRQTLEEWLRDNAQRLDTEPRGDGPGLDTVKAAIDRHQIDKISGIFKAG